MRKEPTWQKLGEGVESRNNGRRGPGGDTSTNLTALGSPDPKEAGEGQVIVNVVPG